MASLTFSTSKQGVIAHDGGRSYRLDAYQVEEILDAFDAGGLIHSFNQLYDCHLACGGCERVTSLRSAA